MDIDPPVPPSSTTKKPKFTPKAPPRRKTGPLLPKSGSSDDDAVADRELLRKVNERLGTRGRKSEKKSSGKVTTLHGGGSSSTPSTTPVQPKDGNTKNSSEKSIVVSSSTPTTTKDGDIVEMSVDDQLQSSKKSKQVYREPWDPNSYYPIRLPWRRPDSGDPELLNAQEFGQEVEYDEKSINSALELGLLGQENNEETQKILFKFPPKLPLGKIIRRVPVSSKGKEKVESSSPRKEASPNVCSGLKDLPDGYMGKMLVYKSGAIKLKLGDTIFDVSSGTPRECAQHVAVMNTESKDCCMLGSVEKHAVVTPDVDSILDGINLIE